ncbi:glycosyltransferase family 4 protein [Nocardioides sp.]|uniref:glycosyltransferase family 4 protein n=1 Tax=Nocardioides sp. TaxID=35761 RepID=UPI002736E236|nr:glycosyltransferase family 4 protein [Nocardioides sp.]MDP3894945.1 glycosyltransferase family 4 protein [Nocardioides sp.]
MIQRTVLMANPSADLYGADLQLLESVAALRDHGWRVVVVTPSTGPLLARLEALGAEVELLPFPVLRRADVSLSGVASLVTGTHDALARMRRLVRRIEPQVLYVNTITLPWWLLAGRTAGVPVVCHVHEAEARDHALVRRALAVPLTLADATIVNSRTTLQVTAAAAPYVRRRLRLVHNGVRGPGTAPVARTPDGVFRLLVVGRLSPRKAPDVALGATALLRSAGRAAVLEVCGTPGPGHEAYADGLRRRAERPDLRGAVCFSGYQSPIWPALERSDVLVAPSLGESFGNAVVEAQLARRPVVATAVQGHLETVEHEVTGLLVPVRDPEAIAAAVTRLMDEPDLGRRLASSGMSLAEARFGIARYGAEVAAVLDELTASTATAAHHVGLGQT